MSIRWENPVWMDKYERNTPRHVARPELWQWIWIWTWIWVISGHAWKWKWPSQPILKSTFSVKLEAHNEIIPLWFSRQMDVHHGVNDTVHMPYRVRWCRSWYKPNRRSCHERAGSVVPCTNKRVNEWRSVGIRWLLSECWLFVSIWRLEVETG